MEYRLAISSSANDPSTTKLLDEAINLIEEARKQSTGQVDWKQFCDILIAVSKVVAEVAELSDFIQQLIR